MMLIKKIGVERHFSAKRATRRTGALLVSRPDAPVILETKSINLKTNGHDFVEDFSTEQSSGRSVSPSK